MATLTIEVPDQIAQALEPLAEHPLDLEPDDLRRLAQRLEVLAIAIEAADAGRPVVTAAQIKRYITPAREESGISDGQFADLLRISFGVERVEQLARGDADRLVDELRDPAKRTWAS